MLSQFPYALQTLANRETTPRKKDTVIHGFIWKRKYNNKRAFEKIKRNVVSLPIEEGGLSLINIEHHQNRFLANWASKLSQTNEATWTITAKEQFTSLGEYTVALNDSVPPTPPQRAQRYENKCKSRLEAGTENDYINESQEGSQRTARTAVKQS